MNRFIKLTILLLAMLLPAIAIASPITPQQAQQNALSFLDSKGKSISSSSLRQARLRSTSAATENYYVFNIGSNEGYVITAGDDCAPAILGYADVGYIDMDSMPVNLKSWLEEYAQQIQFMQENGFDSFKAPTLASTHTAISPLMTTTWGQQDPYNQNCPDFFSYGKCVTGCVATAMAQVMYYHRANSVTQTTAQIPAYDCRTLWLNGSDTLGHIHVDAIPAGSPIDWDNMLESYGNSATAIQKEAVANLMKYCGAAVKMNYANAWSGGSYAYFIDVPIALRSYFNYSDQTSLKLRSNYSSDAEWESLVYNELSSSRPVFYGGQSDSGGHAFVCDGYDGSGYYHINWGWSGTSDGYFLLNALDPDQQGTGGSSSGYNSNQIAVIYAQPKSNTPSNPILATSISLNKTNATVTEGNTLQLTATVLPTNATNRTATWSTSNSAVATVNSYGLVTAIAPGSVTITATTTDGTNLRATCAVTVQQNIIYATSISLNKTSAELNTGGTLQLTATVLPSNTTNKAVTWTTSNSSVATVNSSGVVTAKSAGSATITGRTSDGTNLTASCVVTVQQSNVLATSISLNKSSANLKQGETMQLIATILPYTTTNKNVTWTSSNSTIASVNTNGLVTAKSIGTATITAKTTDGSNLKATCQVTVYAFDQNFETGEWAFLEDGSPAKIGQTTNDHVFVRNNYDDTGEMKTYDNVVTFKSGTPQIVWFWLDDDQIYLNEKVQALPKTLIKDGGAPYNEITYNSFQCNIYLPESVKIVKSVNEDGDEISFLQGDRMPNSANFKFAVCAETKVIDGVTYQPYLIVISNQENNGTHFSAKNATRYMNNGALKKDDAPLFALFLQNDNQNEIEGRLPDMIIANQEFGMREPFIVEPKWEPNDYRFIYGEGGNNETQRFQYYNRVALYGSNGIENSTIYVDGVYLNTTYKSMDVNETFQLTATVTPSYATNKTLTWKSSNTSVATVDNNGNVRAISPGNATITATSTDGSNKSASCYITVTSSDVLATSLSLNANSLELGIDETAQLVATIQPSNTTNKTLNWYSSNTNVATVNNNGLVTAIGEGNATIIATTTDGSNLFATCQVTVNVKATSITLSSSFLTLDVNETTQLRATIYPSNATNKEVTWTTSNPSVATVNSEGVVTTISTGTAIITATTTDGSDLSATCQVIVVRLARSITLNETEISLYVDQTAQLSATIYPSNASNKTIQWKSSNTAVATVSSSGLVTAKSAGAATITASTTDGTNLSASCDVTVLTIPVTSITLNKTSLTLDVSENYQLTATILPSNATNKTVTWTSSNNAIAKVSSTGLVTPVKPGNVTITAKTTDGTNLTATCQVTVVKRITAISLNHSSLTLTMPETAQLVASITPNDATNKVLNWTSSKPSVATVDNNGNVTSVGVGTATIKATTTDGSNLSASCQVTVNKQYVTSITLNENSLILHAGDTYQLTADVQPENASNKTLTWSTGNSSVATVDNNGLVTAVAEGTTYIKAATTDGSYLNASCTIEVLSDYYLTLDTISHVRGDAVRIMDLPVTLINKNLISGIQFDVTLPSGVDFNLVDGLPDVWLDDARATRSHSISANQLSNGKYRVLVTSSSSKDLRGNDGVLVHMNMLLPQIHNTGNYSINISNIIASESDETRHTLSNTSGVVQFYYIVGDADANAIVDIADHASTASKILGKSPTPFYNDAANVDGNSSLDVVDLVGITNIALEIKPISIRQAPIRNGADNRLFCDKLNLNTDDETEITIGMDCSFDFAGFQMDVTLPRGLKLVGATLGDDASKLGLATETMPDGKIRILGTSFSDAEVNGVCPQLLTLRVKADNDYLYGFNIEFSDILFAERNLTAHTMDDLSIEYVEPSAVHELMEDIRIYVKDGIINVDTPVSGTVQLIAVDGRMREYQAQVGHNEYAVDASGVNIIHFKNKTIKVRF